MLARRPAPAPPRLLLGVLLACAAAAAAGAQEVTVQAEVERSEGYVGEPLHVRIVVAGSDQVSAPDPVVIAGFSVRALGGGPNNSEIITTINGRTTREVTRGYVLNYQFTPTEAGDLTIPALTLQVAGQSQRTRALPIRVRAPQETADYRLRLSLEREQVWVGEPVLLTTTWMWNSELEPERVHGLSHPLLDDAAAHGLDYEPQAPAAGREDPVSLPVAGRDVRWHWGRTRIDGQPFTTLSFAAALLPERPGPLRVAPATVVFDGVSGYRRVRDFFGRTVRQPVRQRFVVPSNELTLTVKALPEAGRPAEFSGLVGSFELTAEAAPREVKVGDPVEFTVTIAGRGDLRRLRAPDLTAMDGFGEFRVSADALPALTAQRAALRHTLRALHPEVTAIPPVRINVFDAELGRYAELASAPIPITVHPTREVTLRDVEGAAADQAPSAPVASRREGIAHNYAGPMLLVDQRFAVRSFAASPGGLLALFAAPLALAAARLALLLRRSRPRRPGAALAALRRSLAAAGSEAPPPALLAALRAYLNDYLQPARAVHDFAGAARLLRARGVEEAALEELRALFAALEAARYGAAAAAETDRLGARLAAWAERAERSARR